MACVYRARFHNGMYESAARCANRLLLQQLQSPVGELSRNRSEPQWDRPQRGSPRMTYDPY